MSHTNNTPHYELPQFIASDKGTWLGDLNEAFLKIDNQMFDNAQQVTLSNSTADNAKEVAQTTAQGLASINTVVNKNTSDIATVSRDLGNVDDLPSGFNNVVSVVNTHDTELSRLGGKIATMNNSLSAVESTSNSNTGELDTLSTSVNTLKSDVGSKSVLPNPSVSTNHNIKSLNNQIVDLNQSNGELEDRVNSIYNNMPDYSYVTGVLTYNATTKTMYGIRIGKLLIFFGNCKWNFTAGVFVDSLSLTVNGVSLANASLISVNGFAEGNTLGSLIPIYAPIGTPPVPSTKSVNIPLNARLLTAGITGSGIIVYNIAFIIND